MNLDTNNIKDKLQIIISTRKTKIREYQEILQYIESLESRISFICAQNGAYKDRNKEVEMALMKVILNDCSVGDKLVHKNNNAYKEAFTAIGLRDGNNVSLLEKLIESYKDK